MALFINVLVIFLPVFITQLLYAEKPLEKYNNQFQWTFGLIAGISSILCMKFAIITQVYSEQFLWDLRLIPFMMALIYGGFRGGLIAFILLAGYRMSIGTGSSFYVAMFLCIILFSTVPTWAEKFHAFTRLRKVMASAILSLIVYAIVLVTIGVYFFSIGKQDIFLSHSLLAFALIGCSYLISLVILVLLMEKTIENRRFRHQSNCLIENSLDTIAIVCNDKWVFLNPAGLKLFEATKPEELIGRSFLGLLHPAAHESVKRNYIKVAFEKESIGPIERKWNTLKGNQVNTEVMLIPYIFDNKPAVQIVIRDISERKNAELLLNESRQRYKSIVDYNPDLIVRFDMDTKFCSINPAGERLLGYTRDELIGQSATEFQHMADNSVSYKHYLLAAQGIPQNYETVMRHKDGSPVSMNVTLIPIVVNEQIVGVYAIAHDITMQKSLWDQLYESEERYRSLVEESPEAIFILQDGVIVFANQTALSFLGCTNIEEILGHPAISYIHPDCRESVTNEFAKAREHLRNAIEILDTKCLRVNGEVLDVEINAIPTLFQGVEAEYIVVRDVTELKKSREYLQQTEKLTVVGQLAAGIAHEIRNPLTSLRGFIQLMQSDQLGRNPEFLRIMLSEIDRINTIVGELLLLAKPKEMDFEEKDVASILSEVITLLEPQAALYDIELIPLFCSEQTVILCVENKLKQVFINIIKNAMESMPYGGPVYIQVNVRQGHVIVNVIDHGCGIPAEQLPKIGQAFYTSKEKGTGLGTMISFSIINSHQGQISIESEEHKGTVIEIMLPLVRRG